LAKVVSYELLNTKAVEISGGNSSSQTGPDNSFLKKAKADVVEAEFEQLDVNKTASLGRKSSEIMGDLQKQICSIAQTLNIQLPYCSGNSWDMAQPFYFVYDC
jgi:hypothetical protein